MTREEVIALVAQCGGAPGDRRPVGYENVISFFEKFAEAVIEQHDQSGREEIEQLKSMLSEVGKWDFRGRIVAHEFDIAHGAGSWRRALRSNAK